MTRPAVEIAPRKAMTDRRRREVLEAHDYRCGEPDCDVVFPLDGAGAEIDHIIPVWIGGDESLRNLQPLCRAHHVIKTAHDQGDIAKVKRLQAREDGSRRERKPIPGRGFDGWRTFDGSIRRKERSA